MGTKGTRRSDRIYLRLPIQVTGTDCSNFAFADRTETLVLSAHGALILLKRALAPEQELTLRFPATQKEAGVRVVGQIGEMEEGVCYGVEFLDPEINLWEIEFPPPGEVRRSGGARAARMRTMSLARGCLPERTRGGGLPGEPAHLTDLQALQRTKELVGARSVGN